MLQMHIVFIDYYWNLIIYVSIPLGILESKEGLSKRKGRHRGGALSFYQHEREIYFKAIL